MIDTIVDWLSKPLLMWNWQWVLWLVWTNFCVVMWADYRRRVKGLTYSELVLRRILHREFPKQGWITEDDNE